MKNIFFIILLFNFINVQCVTFVYNLRIAETTRRQTHIQTDKKNIFAALLINQFRKRKDGASQEINVGFASFVYAAKRYFFKMDFAGGNIRQKNLNLSRSQTDDLLITTGYNFLIKEKTKLTLSALVGVPTHDDNILQGLQIGTGHYGLGVQVDASFKYSKNSNNRIFAAARFVHFFPRTLNLQTLGFAPLEFKFDLGNVFDLLLSHQFFISKKQKLELGYSASFGFGSKIDLELPLTDLFNQISFIRSNFYALYMHGFLIKKEYPSAFLLGLSYSFDHKPEILGFKQIITLWGGWGINF